MAEVEYRLWLSLKPIWRDERPPSLGNEGTDWFAAYTYLPRLRDHVVVGLTCSEAAESVRRRCPGRTTIGLAEGEETGIQHSPVGAIVRRTEMLAGVDGC